MSHSSECIAARGGSGAWPLMWKLKVEAQEAILTCPDPAHSSVRFLLHCRPCVPGPMSEWARS